MTSYRKKRFLSRRLVELAAPRQGVAGDGTYYYNWRMNWGNQVFVTVEFSSEYNFCLKEPIRKISTAALTAISTDRIDELSKPRLSKENMTKMVRFPIRPIDVERVNQLSTPRNFKCKFTELLQQRVWTISFYHHDVDNFAP